MPNRSPSQEFAVTGVSSLATTDLFMIAKDRAGTPRDRVTDTQVMFRSLPDGSLASPGLAFLSEESGLSLPAAGNMAFSVGGAEVGRFVAAGLSLGTAVVALNPLDVEGSVVVGAGYAGVETAPANGALFQGNVGIGTTSPAGPLHLRSGASGIAPNILADEFHIELSADGGMTISGTTTTACNLFFADPDSNAVGRIVYDHDGDDFSVWVAGVREYTIKDKQHGFGTGAPSGKVHVRQENATGVIPALVLQQLDVDQDMIEFICTIGVGNAIEAVGAKALTTTHFIKVTLPGSLVRYFPVGTIA